MRKLKWNRICLIFCISIEIVSSLPRDDDGSLNFPFSHDLNSKGQVSLRWNFDNDAITMQLTAPTLGWIGLGFNYKVSMQGADLTIMGIENDQVYALDAYAEDNEPPRVEDVQNIEIIAGYENGTHTTVTVKRMLTTCDENDMEIKEGTYRVLWAFGQNDIDGTPTMVNYHMRNRGGKSLKLLNHFPQIDLDAFGDDLNYFDIRPHNFKVPATDTYYMCQFFEVPNPSKKHHVIGIDPVITPGNEGKVHHLVIYLCPALLYPDSLNTTYNCYKDFDLFSAGCFNFFAGWAVGVTEIRFPEHTGIPIGGPNQDRYLAMEMHYDNPEVKEFYDSSGLRFYYTDELREYDIGSLVISYYFPGIWVPPESNMFRIEGICPETCITQAMEKSNLDEVTVLGTMLHAHLAARDMKLRTFRNNTELRPMAVDEHYDFDYQETQYFEDGKIKLRRGDSLMVECGYRTRGKKTVTTGGQSTKKEMCNAFVFYYPAIKLDFCASISNIMDNEALLALISQFNITFSFQELLEMTRTIQNDFYEITDIVASKLNQVEWTDEKKIWFENYMKKTKKIVQCTDGDTQILSTVNFEVKDYSDYVKPDQCKEKKTSEMNESYDVRLYILAGVVISAMVLTGARFTTSTS